MTDTILLTGISGFIAKHVALRLLQAGHPVRGTLRHMARADEVRRALAPHLPPDALARLSFAEADLENDRGWDRAMADVQALVHTASPFVVDAPRDPQVLIRPAVEGTRRVLTAAARAGVQRVVLTSSVAAIETPGLPGTLDEGHWCDLTRPGVDAYVRSKTLAERKAWEIAASEGLQLTTINPALVLGPPLDAGYGTSVALIARILRGRDPMMPDLSFGLIDVRDVAEMHLRALQRPETAGQRLIGAAGVMSMVEMARTLKSAWPDRRIPQGQAPRALLAVLALFDRSLRSVMPRLGWRPDFRTDAARTALEMEFLPAETALLATADFLLKSGKV